jgi:hypothetical protein
MINSTEPQRTDSDPRHFALFAGAYLAVLIVVTFGYQGLGAALVDPAPSVGYQVTPKEALDLLRSPPLGQPDLYGQDREIHDHVAAAPADRDLAGDHPALRRYGLSVRSAYREAKNVMLILSIAFLAFLCPRYSYRRRDAIAALVPPWYVYITFKMLWRATSPRPYWVEGNPTLRTGWKGHLEGILLILVIVGPPWLAAILAPTPSWWVQT